MKFAKKSSLFASLFLVSSLLLAACSGPVGGAGGGGGGVGTGGAGPYTIGGTVTGLTGTGLVLQDNGGDDLTITGNTTFTFKTTIAAHQPYNVTVSASPSNPVQTCTVSGGSGTATANVTTVIITCSTGTASIGGQVVGLLGTGLTLQNNGGDNLTIPTNGPFTFKTAIPLGTAYLVTVSVQPTSPVQTCTVTNGSGTASAAVGNIQITCSTGTLSVGGTVTGLAKAGSGLILQDNGGDNLTIKANGSFTFPTLIPSGGTYKVTILTQPSGPNQSCTVSNGSGTTTVNVVNVQVICPAIFHTIGGTVVGLVGTNSGMVLQNNLGDNLTISSDGTFTFNTPIADGSTYDVQVFVGPTTQAQGCVVWAYQGTATAAVTSVIVDCGHNDWSWFDGLSTENQKGTFSAPPAPPPAAPVFDTDTPGGRKYPATWTDLNNQLWLFGGYGLTYTTGVTPPATDLDDMWVYTGTQNYNGSYQNYWNNTDVPFLGTGPFRRDGAVTWTNPTTGDLWLFGGQAGTTFLNDLWSYKIASPPGPGTWTSHGGGANLASTATYPGSRWGATTKTDVAAGNVWVFGGFGYDSTGALGLLNDLWVYNIAAGTWTLVGGSNLANQTGVYGTQGTAAASNIPGGRQIAMSFVDASGNFWLFGGFDLDSKGNPAALNDLWEFNATTKQWTWQSGASVANQTGVYGTQGVGASTNVPGARWSAAAWTDVSGNFWIFGGQGYDSTGNGSLSDVWEYKGGQWIWVKGPASVSQAGTYGLLPGPIIYPYVGDTPGSRFAPAYWYVHHGANNPGNYDEFWMFGGEGFDSAGVDGNGLLSDLWRYLPFP
jgi:N-acetylneuraminic acid mutarotase